MKDFNSSTCHLGLAPRTEWGHAFMRWLERLPNPGGRQKRGQEAFRAGAVKSLTITSGSVRGQIKGHLGVTFETNISIPAFTPQQSEHWRALLEGRGTSPARLLVAETALAMVQREHPELGLLFNLATLKKSCSCPDWSDFCVHAWTLLFAMASEWDASPALYFSLRGLHWNLDPAPAQRDPAALWLEKAARWDKDPESAHTQPHENDPKTEKLLVFPDGIVLA